MPRRLPTVRSPKGLLNMEKRKLGALIRAKVEYLAGHGRVFPVHPKTKAPLAGGWGGRNGSEVPRLKAKEVLEGLEAGAALGYKPSSLGLSVLDVDNLLETEDWEDFQNLELEHPPLSWYDSVSGEGAHMLYNFSEEAGNGGWDYDCKTLTGEVRSAKGYCVAPVPLGVEALYDAATMAFHEGEDAPFPVSLQLRAERPEKERKTVTRTAGTLDDRTPGRLEGRLRGQDGIRLDGAQWTVGRPLSQLRRRGQVLRP